MNNHDSDRTDECLVCGEPVDVDDPRNLAVSASSVVCYECARRFDGVYDSRSERWTVLPHIPEEYLGAARQDL